MSRGKNGWNVTTLKEHLDAQLQAHKDQHEASGRSGLMIWEDHRREHEAEHEALKEGREALDRRLEGINAFRAQLRDQQGTFVTREVLDAIIQAQAEKIDSNTMRIERAEGRGGGISSSVALVISILGVLGMVASLAIGILIVTHK